MYGSRRPLSPPPSIEDRIRAAIKDEYPYQVVYYNRMEGATTAAIGLAKKDENILIMSPSRLKRMYSDEGIAWRNSDEPIRVRLNQTTIITDVVHDKRLMELRRDLLPQGFRIIALKAMYLGD